MADNFADGQISWKRQFPALRLIEVPGLALSPRAILIGALASVLVSFSGWLVDRLLPIVNSASITVSFPDGLKGVISIDTVELLLPVEIVPGPLLTVIQPVAQILGPSAGMLFRLNWLAKFVIALGIWSLIGGILCRRTAYRFGGDDEKTLIAIVQYSIKRWLASFGSPLIPLSAASLLALMVACFGLIVRLPYLGTAGLFLSSPVLLIVGLLMAFLLLATALSWPLMVSAVAIDDCESFGGLSRAYSSLIGRPWHLIGYFLVCCFLGRILMAMADVFESVAVWSVLSSLQIGSGSNPVQESLLSPLNGLIYSLMSGIGISYFWSAATVIYLLIRLEIDRVPIDRIAPDDSDRPVHEPLPVVGIPATDAWIDSNGSASSGTASPGNPDDVL